MEITYKIEKYLNSKDVLALYSDVGWKAYTDNPDILMNSIKNSLYVITAWDKNILVGLIRLIGDGFTIVYIQDILVSNKYRRNGIGKNLLLKAMERFKNVRQKVLLTEDTKETRSFYESLGFESCDKGVLVAFTKLI